MNRIVIAQIILVVVTISAILLFKFVLHPNKKSPLDIKPKVLTEDIVTITKSGFEPATLTIHVGDQVRFVNKDVINHRVTSDPYPLNTSLPNFDSIEPLSLNDSYTYSFDSKGTFTYHDFDNPLNLTGSIVVK